MNNSPYYTHYGRVLAIITIYILLLSTNSNTVGINSFGKIWSILFNNVIFEYFIQYLMSWSIKSFLIVQESYVFSICQLCRLVYVNIGEQLGFSTCEYLAKSNLYFFLKTLTTHVNLIWL